MHKMETHNEEHFKQEKILAKNLDSDWELVNSN